MARTYRRDARGRFSSGGGSSGKGGGKGGGGKAKPATAKAKPAAKAKPKAASKPAAGKGKAKPTTSKPSPAAKGSRKPATSKPSATASRKPALPPPIPDNLLRAAGVARAGAAARRSSGGPANKIAPSPRRHTAAEAAYWQIKTGKGKSKFRSDKAVREEMQRRGFLKGSKDPQGDLILIASRARRKKGKGV